jgi:hypothetical protein
VTVAMHPRLLVRLYPSRWRRRYEDEFGAILEQESWSARLIVDVVAGALAARLDPYPVSPQEERAMPPRRMETAAAFAATLLVLPAVVLLASAAVRLMQPVQYQPAHAADVIFNWFATLHAGPLVLGVGPILALGLGLLATWRRLSSDADLRKDLSVFSAVSGRLLRRPALVAGLFAVLGSLAVLLVVVDHAIAG